MKRHNKKMDEIVTQRVPEKSKFKYREEDERRENFFHEFDRLLKSHGMYLTSFSMSISTHYGGVVGSPELIPGMIHYEFSGEIVVPG